MKPVLGDWIKALPKTESFFVYAEDVSEIAFPEAIDAPDGSVIPMAYDVFKEAPVRFRSSGPEAQSFMEDLGNFEVLDSYDISPEQRQSRTTALDAFFEKTRIPIIDLFVSLNDEQFPAIRRTLVPSTWHLAIIGGDDAADAPYPVFISDPENDVEEAIVSSNLLALLPISPELELRLRDIFSLNHVRDADLDNGEDEGDDGAGAPVDPRAPGGEQVDAHSYGVEQEVSEHRLTEEEAVVYRSQTQGNIGESS